MTRIGAIRAREREATPGPWATKADGITSKIIIPTADFREFSHHDPPNAEFIAHARADVPYLLTRLDDVSQALVEVLNLPENTMATAWEYRRQVLDKAREALAALRARD